MLALSPLASAPIAGAGIVLVSSLSATETQDTASAAVNITADAVLSATESQDTASVSAQITASINFALIETQDTASGSVSAVTLASLAVTEAQDTASISAQIDPAIAVLAATENPDTASITTAIVASASLAATEAQDTASFSTNAVTLASLAATENPDTASFAVETRDTVYFALVEQPDTASFNTALVANITLAATEAPDSASGGMVVQWAVIPDGASVWTPQAASTSFWQSVDNSLPPSNEPRLGGPIASGCIGGFPIAATAAAPSGGAIGTLWTSPTAGIVYWDTVQPLQPSPNSRPTGALGGSPIGGVATAEGVADNPSATPGGAVWTPITASFTPTQQQAA